MAYSEKVKGEGFLAIFSCFAIMPAIMPLRIDATGYRSTNYYCLNISFLSKKAAKSLAFCN